MARSTTRSGKKKKKKDLPVKTKTKVSKDDLFCTEVDVKELIQKIMDEKDKRNEVDERIKTLNEELLETLHKMKEKDFKVNIGGEIIVVAIVEKESVKVYRDK